jgi:hypothetical protein
LLVVWEIEMRARSWVWAVVLLGLGALVGGGCRCASDDAGQDAASHEPEDAAAAGGVTTEDAAQGAATADAAQALKDVTRWVERQRVETPGYVFGLALGGGKGLATTRDGRLAVYWMGGQEGLLNSVTLGGGLTPVKLGERFALLGQVGDAEGMGRGVMYVLDGQGKVEREWAMGVMPVDALAWGGLWWVVDRGALDGMGLLGVNPETGEVVERVETGQGGVVVEVAVVGERLAVSVMAQQGEGGWVVMLGGEAGARKVRREAVSARLMRIIAGQGAASGVMYGLLNGPGGVAVLDAQTGVSLGVISVDVVASEVIVSAEGQEMWVLSAQGALLRLRLAEGGQSGEETQRLKLGPGSSQMTLWADPTTGERGLWLLDRHDRALRWLDPQTLTERQRVGLVGTVGRMKVDTARGEVVVSLPELEQVVWVGIETSRE